MCGIAGSLGRPTGAVSPRAAVQGMANAIAHRGPDDVGLWSDVEAGVCLANRRLSILDTSAAGHQPMVSASGRFVVTFNGEIYNHADLRQRLERGPTPPRWRGHSDTETLTVAIDTWGIERALQAFVGMFAVAVWDRDARELTLARDRIGEKPLHFGRFGDLWLFGSELKALTAHPAFRPSIDRRALATYLSVGYVPAPATIHERCEKVMPGTMVVLRADEAVPRRRAYWSLASASQLDHPRPMLGERDAVDALDALVGRAVAEQMVADRPVGALLSGGVDSSTVVAFMAAHGPSRVRTFSIGYEQSRYNEADFASRVAAHLGTSHTELYVRDRDVLDAIPRMPALYDEPFSDVSQLPTFLVSRLAGESVTVALTGDGGDELFGGYPRYSMAARLWPAIDRIPPSLRRPIGGFARRAPRAIDTVFARFFPHDEVSGGRGVRPAQKLDKLGQVVQSRDLDTFYWRLLAPWGAGARLMKHPPVAPDFPAHAWSSVATIEEDFMLRDLAGYLSDDILVKVDRAAMNVGLETRAPLLDHRIVEFALRLPLSMKIRGATGKWLLREVLHRKVPKALVDRPKMGFDMPIASWLRGPLKSWAYDLVAARRSADTDLLDRTALRRVLDHHVSGAGDGHQPLWAALMYLTWAEAYDSRTVRTARAAREEESSVVA